MCRPPGSKTTVSPAGTTTVAPRQGISRETDGFIGTVGIGVACVIPFIYEDKTYYNCIDIADSTYGRFGWCSTTPQFEGKWGSCAETNWNNTVSTYEISVVENSSPLSQISVPLMATDVDARQKLEYKIVQGNDGGLFAIDACNGQLSVSQMGTFDFETKQVHQLTIAVSAEAAAVAAADAPVSPEANKPQVFIGCLSKQINPRFKTAKT